MKAYIITLKDNKMSEAGADRLIKSSEKVGNAPESLHFVKFAAVTPETVDNVMKDEGVWWNYPHTGSEFDVATLLTKRGYGGRDPKRRQACGMSHYLLWKECLFLDEPILIFEHDAEFINKFDVRVLLHARKYKLFGLNDPRGATRLPGRYHEEVQKQEGLVVDCPKIDKDDVPQGIAGASAYCIRPAAAEQLLAKVQEVGMWNNDALVCRQLFPWLGQTKTYYTRIQSGMKSTTMG